MNPPEPGRLEATAERRLDKLAEAAKANLIVDWVAIQGAGIERDAPVRLHLYHVSVGDALGAIFDAVPQPQDSLEFRADGNMIHVSTADQLPWPTTTVIYDVTSLLNRPGDGPLPRAAEAKNDDSPADKLAGLIEEMIAPPSWVENGGRTGSIRALMGRLVVTQTPENHRQIAQLLRQLASGGQPILPATQPTRKDPKPLLNVGPQCQWQRCSPK